MLPLVDYSGSSCSDDEPAAPPAKKIRLPNILKDMPIGQPKSDDESDDPNAHQGRVRSFAHERGNWATYAYVDFETNDALEELQQALIKHTDTECKLELLPTDHLHVSLTRTVVLQHHWIELFIESIRNFILNHSRFPIHLSDVNIYCNDDRTRTFVGLQVAPSDCPPAKRLVEDLDRTLDEFRLPPFYKEASFHVSILWCAGDQREKLLAQRAAFRSLLDDHIARNCADDDEDSFVRLVERIDCKIGNKIYAFPLR